jgi:hypothetical protein
LRVDLGGGVPVQFRVWPLVVIVMPPDVERETGLGAAIAGTGDEAVIAIAILTSTLADLVIGRRRPQR